MMDSPDVVSKRLEALDDRLRTVETKTEVIAATMITWKRLLAVLATVATIGSVVFGTAVVIGDRLWGT
jgi:energy-converting hydrogenase Eha subunit H